MPSITTILTDTNQGLIPWLDANLTGTYQRLQVRPWSFNGADQKSGFRLLDFTSDNSMNALTMTRAVRLGRIFQMTDNIDATIEAGVFIEQMCALIHKAPDCRMHVQDIDRVSGSSFAKQNEKTGKHWMIVVAQFDLTYYYD